MVDSMLVFFVYNLAVYVQYMYMQQYSSNVQQLLILYYATQIIGPYIQACICLEETEKDEMYTMNFEGNEATQLFLKGFRVST